MDEIQVKAWDGCTQDVGITVPADRIRGLADGRHEVGFSAEEARKLRMQLDSLLHRLNMNKPTKRRARIGPRGTPIH